MRESASNADEATLRKGFELMHQKFQAFLDARGVSRLECRGQEFDPNQHDAILMQPREGFPAGLVLEEVTPGYKLGERVIRHAQVVVSSEPVDQQANSSEKEAE
jgi:molecular chaperone GrpE